MPAERARELWFDDVEVGLELLPFSRTIGMVEICRWGGISEELARSHIDKSYARDKLHYPDADIQGHLKAGLLGTFLSRWLGDAGTLKRMACQYRGLDYCGDTLTARGRVLKKYEADGEGRVDLEVWIENQRMERNTTGSAIATLPRRLGR